MKHPPPTPEDLGELHRHRLFVPALAWAVALLLACVLSLFDASPQPAVRATAQVAAGGSSR